MATRFSPQTLLKSSLGVGSLLLVIMFVLSGSFVATGGATPQSTPTPTEPQSLRSRDFGTWRYSAYQDGTNVASKVEYDTRTVQSLQAYADANRELANILTVRGGSIQVNVTFRNYVAPDEFRIWARTLNLVPDYVAIRALRSDGVRATLSISPDQDDPLPQSKLTEGFAPAERLSGPLQVEGVYFMVVTVAAANLRAIANDPQVFLADVTTDAVRNDLVDAAIEGGEQAEVDVSPPFWRMEDLGLVNFR